MKTELKNQIESYFEQENFEEVSGLLDKYKEQYPSDRDLWFYECVLALTVGELEKAQKIADKCVHKFPTSYESYYYQASVYQAKGMILEALKSYHIAYALNLYTHYANDSILEDIKAQIKNLEDSFEKLLNEYIAYNDSVNISRMLSFLNRQDVVWGKDEKMARFAKKLVVGKEYWVTDDDLRYIGIYRAPFPQFIGEENLSLIRTKAEFLKFDKKGNGSFVKGTSDEYLLPIASVENDNTHTFQSQEEVHKVG